MTAPVTWIKFHPGKWQSDLGLRKCSVTARGLWMEMICLMHEATPYGHLAINGKAISERDLVEMIGRTDLREVNFRLRELEDAGVFSRTSDGVIYSRRMVRDNENREKGRVNGKLGGNPALGGVNPSDHDPDPKGIKLEKEREREEEKEKEKRSSLRSDPKEKPARATPDPKGQRLAEDWVPGPEGAEYARKLGLDPKATFAVFRNYWLSKPGVIARKLDWSRTWQNWCMTEAKRSGAIPPTGGNGSDIRNNPNLFL